MGRPPSRGDALHKSSPSPPARPSGHWETRPWLEWQGRPCTLRASTAVFLRGTLLDLVASGVPGAQRDEVGGLALLEHAKLQAHVQADDELAVPDAEESLHRRDKTGEPSRHSHLRLLRALLVMSPLASLILLFLVQLVFLLFLFSFLSLSLVSCARLPVWGAQQ